MKREQPEHLRLPPGVRDLGPDRAPQVARVHHAWMEHARLAAYRETRLAPFGYRSTFTIGHSAAGDSLYKVVDRGGGRELCLSSDSLAAGMRFVSTSSAPETRIAFACPIFRCRHGRSTYWTQIGAMEASRRPGTKAASDARVVRLASLVCTFLARGDARLWVNDLALWRSALVELGPSADDVVLQALGKAPVESWSEVLDGLGATTAAIRRLAGLARLGPLSVSRARGVLAEWSEEETPATRAAFLALVDLGAELERRAHGDTVIATASLHGREFGGGASFQLRDVASARVVADGGDFSRYAQRAIGPDIELWSAAFGLEWAARLEPAERDGAADVLCQVVTDTSACRRIREALCEALRHAGLSVFDGADGDSLRSALGLARSLGIRLMASVEVAANGVATVRVGDGVETAHLSPDDAVTWLAARRG